MTVAAVTLWGSRIAAEVGFRATVGAGNAPMRASNSFH